ncbi:AAA family ATPase [Candidatus Dependentiae bacterium]|nr:AAA family ATPase [Candidatus Dependentiae bacterium]
MSINPQIVERIKSEGARWQTLKTEIQKVVVGQDLNIERILIGLLCNGHVLLEGVPGLAKTTMVKTLSLALGLQFSRIQFTPDLLPSDLLGTLIYNQKTGEFITKKGPVFTNILLADEINRSPAKVQSALLEAMQEHQVTIGEQTFKIDSPFLVLATQNPIDQEGTYHLPEAQVDRFMFKLHLTYPTQQEEKLIVSRQNSTHAVQQVLSHQDILDAQACVKDIFVDERITDYIISIVHATRNPEAFGVDAKQAIAFGASPRATIALQKAAQALAFIKKRHFVIPEDVKALVHDTLRHRIIMSYEAEADSLTSDMMLDKIISTLQSP